MVQNADLLARRTNAVPRGVASATPVFASRAEDSEIWDVEGKRFIDFAGGIGVLNVGHRHPRVIEAARRQIDAYTHTSFQVVPYEPYVELAERLIELAPFEGPAKAVFFTTGAEAVENAVRIARIATGRTGVIAFTGGFHGRTALTSAMTGKVLPYKKGAGPMPPDVFHIPFPIAHQGVSVDDSLRALDQLFRASVDPERIAAIIIEPVQGEGGFYVAPTELLVRLREIADKHGILLIADEVQSGFARTGRMFAIEHSGVQPDLVTTAKSLSGGFPLSGVIGRAAIMDKPEPGALGGTYGGNPVACAAALAVIDVIRDEGLLARSEAIGARVEARLHAIAESNTSAPIGAIRRLGGMIAFEVFRERGGTEPDAAATKRLTQGALDKGLVILSCGNFGNVVRILVPLTVSDDVLDEGLDILAAAAAA